MNRLFGAICLVSVLLTACTTDPVTEKNKALLLGRWEIKEAMRNGKLTEALDGIYFEFLPENQMVSNFNLSVEDRRGEFTLKKLILTEQNEIDRKRVFEIQQLDEQNLIFSTEYQEMRFKLHLIPSE
ncbi:MAG: hypothetical protein AAGD05_03910 [Bacteroidota bacterium]